MRNQLRKFSEIYEFGKRKLEESGAESAKSDLLNIFWYCFGMNRSDIILRSAYRPTESEYDNFCKVLERRCNGEPLQYAVGKWEFMGMELSVGEGVLIPREDTTVLVNAALDKLRGIDKPKILDLCSGSGCIALSIEKNLDSISDIYAVEVSDMACKYLERNLLRYDSKVKLINKDIFGCYADFEDNFFDLIISNPPYIETGVIPKLQLEVQYEPIMALDGGIDGLEFYRKICKLWLSKLKVGGVLAFEIGQGQFEQVKEIMETNGIVDIEGFLDINNMVRAVVGKKCEK